MKMVVVGRLYVLNLRILEPFHIAAPNSFGALRHFGNTPSRYSLVSGREGVEGEEARMLPVCCRLSR